MSSRAVRRHLRNEDKDALGMLKNADDSNDDDVIGQLHEQQDMTSNNNINKFRLLIPDDSDSEIKEDTDDESFSKAPDDFYHHCCQNRTSLQKTKLNKKKKKNRGTVNVESATTSKINDEFSSNCDVTEELLGEYSLMAVPLSEVLVPKSILQCEIRHFNWENEMKRIFGSKVVNGRGTSTSSSKSAKTNSGRNTLRSGNFKKIQRNSMRFLISYRSQWIRFGKCDMSLRLVKKDDLSGNSLFAFEYSPAYKKVQESFLMAIHTSGPQLNIMGVVKELSTHIDSLIYFSEICKMGEDLQMASELIERAIYFLEGVILPHWSINSQNCRLDYRHQPNRSFFIVLFRHIQYVGARGCCRTSLEFCKFLLSLDPDTDPTGVILMLDFYALRCQQFTWFISFYETYEASKNLSQLPNFAYSIALAYFFLSKAAQSDPCYASQSDAYLQAALFNFPEVLCPLLHKCSIEPDTSIKSHEHFMSHSGTPDALTLLCDLYVERMFHVWRISDNILPWIERNVSSVVKDLKAGHNRREWIQTRQLRYSSGTPLNIYRHVMMSDVSSLTRAIPTIYLSRPTLSFDPVPPEADLTDGTQHLSNVNEGENIFHVFLRSVMPNYVPSSSSNNPNPQDRLMDGADGIGASVVSLLSAMSNLFQISGDPNAVFGEDEEEATAETDDDVIVHPS